MKTTVIHHSADADGLFCREIAHKFLPDAELIGWDFKDAPLAIPDGQIYILDLPVDRVFGFVYSKDQRGETVVKFLPGAPHHFLYKENPFEFSERVVWIDHHKSSIESHHASIPGYRIDGVAACRLAWQWFNCCGNPKSQTIFNQLPRKQDFIDRKVSEPLAVRLAGEYDIWCKDDPRAELFQHGLRTCEIEPRMWKDLLSTGDDGVHSVEAFLRNGKVLQFARANEYAEVITQQGFDVEFEGVNFLACNSHELDIRSHLFTAGIKPHHSALLGFTYNGVSKDWRVSMYHIDGRATQPDILSIAKKYGGGGHPGANGCRIDKLPFLP